MDPLTKNNPFVDPSVSVPFETERVAVSALVPAPLSVNEIRLPLPVEKTRDPFSLTLAVGGALIDGAVIAFTVNGSKFLIGELINAVVSFLLIGAAVYFFIVLPVNKLLARMRRGEAAPDPTTKKCPECLSEVPIAARRCAFCTSSLVEASPAIGPGTRDQPLPSAR